MSPFGFSLRTSCSQTLIKAHIYGTLTCIKHGQDSFLLERNTNFEEVCESVNLYIIYNIITVSSIALFALNLIFYMNSAVTNSRTVGVVCNTAVFSKVATDI